MPWLWQSVSFSFDPDTYTLTLNSVTATGDLGNDFIYYPGTEGEDHKLTIDVKGTNNLTSGHAGFGDIIRTYKDTEITSNCGGKLYILGDPLTMGIYFRSCNLVLSGDLKLTCDITQTEHVRGIVNDSTGNLTVKDDVELKIDTTVSDAAINPWSCGIYANGKITASQNFDGSSPETFTNSIPSNKLSTNYQYLKIEKGADLEIINSLAVSGLERQAVGEMPSTSEDTLDSENVRCDYYWCVWNEEEGDWDTQYTEEEGGAYVEECPFMEEKEYALYLYVLPKSDYIFKTDMSVTYNGSAIPDYNASNPKATSKEIGATGSYMRIFVRPEDMSASTKTLVTSARFTLNGYTLGANVADMTVDTEATGATRIPIPGTDKELNRTVTMTVRFFILHLPQRINRPHIGCLPCRIQTKYHTNQHRKTNRNEYHIHRNYC